MEDKSVNKNDTKSFEKSKKIIKDNIVWILLSIVLSIVLLALYRVCMIFEFFPIVLALYAVMLVAFCLAYLIYNRGFSRSGVDEEMLPSSWDDEKKHTYVESARRRFKNSKWMLTVTVALLFTFTVDAVELFVVQYLFR